MVHPDILFWGGGVDTQHTLPFGTPEKVEAECKANIDAMAKGGGFMLATGCELISPDAFDNARLMVEIAKTYGAYQK